VGVHNQLVGVHNQCDLWVSTIKESEQGDKMPADIDKGIDDKCEVFTLRILKQSEGPSLTVDPC
jgi:hypothetical protein